MAEENFGDFIARERQRLNAEREQIFNQQHELEGKLAEINRELAAIDAWETAPTANALRESTVIEYGTPSEVLFASSLPLEFDDKMRLENHDGSLLAEASVVALQYQGGSMVVAARFSRPLPHWIIK